MTQTAARSPGARRAQAFVANLNNAMADQGLIQQALAAKANVGAATLSDIRRGNQWPSMQVVAKLEAALGTALWPAYRD